MVSQVGHVFMYKPALAHKAFLQCCRCTAPHDGGQNGRKYYKLYSVVPLLKRWLFTMENKNIQAPKYVYYNLQKKNAVGWDYQN